ncbi:hypothetical protein EB796_020681 [Bugula neritina]|uniref:Uncharacterized protein n=1 Tax=Bugula neritina TaxID=10212 RepID=A0A7J7J5N7_BUGNE|nr:hypothetical protein EB796_020681 [Bugula neritina]
MLIAFLDMVVLDSLIIFLTRVNVILLYEKPKEPTKSCTFKPSSFSVYGTDEMYIENVKIFPYSSVELFASWTDTKYDKVVVALLNTETSSHTYLSHTYLSHSYNNKPLSALTLSNCDQYNLVTAEFNRKTKEICVQFSQLNARHGFDGVDFSCSPLAENDVEGIIELSVSCNYILYFIVTHERLGNVLYKWNWPTITDLTKELKVNNANPPLVGNKSSKGQGLDTSAENSLQLLPYDLPAVSQTFPGIADTATNSAVYSNISAAPKAEPKLTQPDMCSKSADKFPTIVNQMQMKSSDVEGCLMSFVEYIALFSQTETALFTWLY